MVDNHLLGPLLSSGQLEQGCKIESAGWHEMPPIEETKGILAA